jgi:hypothetical protein
MNGLTVLHQFQQSTDLVDLGISLVLVEAFESDFEETAVVGESRSLRSAIIILPSVVMSAAHHTKLLILPCWLTPC